MNALTELSESDARTWTFEVDGFHLDGVQVAKQRVAQEYDAEYKGLRGKVVNAKGVGQKYVVVVET